MLVSDDAPVSLLSPQSPAFLMSLPFSNSHLFLPSPQLHIQDLKERMGPSVDEPCSLIDEEEEEDEEEDEE